MKPGEPDVYRFLRIGIFAMTLAASSSAQIVPPMVNYQGRLSAADGTPLPTATYSLAFSIFAAPCGSAPCGDSPVWGPATMNADVVQGYFNVVLALDGEGDPVSDAFRAKDRYVEVSVDGGAPILPRQQVLSSPYAIQADNGVPVGALVPFAGGSVPAGYLACDGAEVSRADYAALFAVIGTAWGAGDGATTFHLPDLRGRFVRGHDAGVGRDVDAGSRTASNAGGATGDAVGSVQGDRLRQHRHRWGRTTNQASGFDRDIISHDATGAEITVANGTPQSSAASGSNNDDAVAFANSAQLYTAPELPIEDAPAETRPINASVLFVIKH